MVSWHFVVMCSSCLLGAVLDPRDYFGFPYPLAFSYLYFYMVPQLVMILTALAILAGLVRRTASALIAGTAVFWLSLPVGVADFFVVGRLLGFVHV